MGDDLLAERRGALGLLTLNRPQALNALTLAMSEAMTAQLDAWAADPAIRTVAIRGAGDRAFCAGGDVRALYEARGRDPGYAPRFYAAEYRLNRLIKRYPKPYVALIDGIVMGGGVGVSFHGSDRVVTENALFAMPETGIGLFPDVGGTWFLPRCPGEIGLYLGLTGARIKAADLLYAGLATAEIVRERLPALIDRLAAGETPAIAISALRATPDPAPLETERSRIDRLFAGPRMEAILAALEGDGSDFARKVTTELGRKSPTSLKVTLRQLSEGRTLSFEDCMRLEYRLVLRFMENHDFFEGVRTVVLEKTGTPAWKPARLEEIEEAAVERYFMELPGGDLRFD
ncbi:MAG: enoyl-CoA hydratase/isomerase family protein [Dongiaceae bacterium]